MAEDWIDIFCKGVSDQFGGVYCEFYLRFNNDCKLLREHELREIFERGRCHPAELLRTAVIINLTEYRELVRPEEYADAITFEALEHLQSKQITQGFTLYVLKGYVYPRFSASICGKTDPSRPRTPGGQASRHLCQTIIKGVEKTCF